MNEMILLLALWPFHHKAQGTIQCEGSCNAGAISSDDILQSLPPCPPHNELFCPGDGVVCTKSGNVWFYTEEGITDIGASCEAAKKDYNSAHIDPVRMSRS